jgi:hypothetical protein
MRALKLMADYDCWPLWEASPGATGNVDPSDLPISESLKDRLARWAADFDATLDRDNPSQSGFSTPEEEAAFVARGLTLGTELQAELGPTFQVSVKVS